MRNSIPDVSIEGLQYNHDGSALYYVDEDRSASIYKFIPTTKGDYTNGQTFELKVEAFSCDASAKAGKHTNNNPAERNGATKCVAMTDAEGIAPTTDELDATPFRRPGDLDVGYLKNGIDVLCFTATEEPGVIS